MTEQELFEEVAQLVEYDPETGSMLWRRRGDGADSKRWNNRHAGKECGRVTDNGYRRLGYTPPSGKTRQLLAHRLAWFIVYGNPPKNQIDHIDGQRSNNRIKNLRDVPVSLNLRNQRMRRTNTSGVTGVTWKWKREKWAAQVHLNGKQRHLGYFDDIPEAAAVVKAFRAKHGFTETHGEAA